MTDSAKTQNTPQNETSNFEVKPQNQISEASLSKGLDKTKLKKALLFGGIALIVLFAGFFIFSYLTGRSPNGILSPIAQIVDDGDKKDVVNPLNGTLYTAFESADWSSERPLAAMINNHVDARPQSGLIDADLVYEMVAEAGITRFLAFFQSTTPDKIGPIRSTRHYYLILVKEVGDAMLAHIGWSPQALEAIETWPVRSFARAAAEFWRDQDRLNAGVATEHTAYYDGKYLREYGEELGWGGKNEEFRVWKFKEDAPLKGATAASNITIHFWYEGDYTAHWEYDSETNAYKRFMGYDADGNFVPHVDQESGDQIVAKNLIVQFATETAIIGDDKGRLDYQLEGSGEGLVFRDGGVRRVTWSKEDRDSRTIFYDENGEEIEFNRGKIWIHIVREEDVALVTYT